MDQLNDTKWLLLLIIINEKPKAQQVSHLPEAKQTQKCQESCHPDFKKQE